MVESPNLAWFTSKHSFNAGARLAILSAEGKLNVAGPDHPLFEPLSSTHLYTNLGNYNYGLGGFEGLSHPLFNRLVHPVGSLETTYDNLYEPVHRSISRFLDTLSDPSAQRMALDQLAAMEKLADYMKGVSTQVRYTSIGVQYSAYEITPT